MIAQHNGMSVRHAEHSPSCPSAHCDRFHARGVVTEDRKVSLRVFLLKRVETGSLQPSRRVFAWVSDSLNALSAGDAARSGPECASRDGRGRRPRVGDHWRTADRVFAVDGRRWLTVFALDGGIR